MTASARGTVESPGRNESAESGLNQSVLEQSWCCVAGWIARRLDDWIYHRRRGISSYEICTNVSGVFYI